MSNRLSRITTLLTVYGCLVGTAAIAIFADEPRVLSEKTFMRVKLQTSAKVLEGIVTRDFKLIDQGREMQEMSRGSAWPRAKDDTYEHYGAEF